jgi:hypothetical protein
MPDPDHDDAQQKVISPSSDVLEFVCCNHPVNRLFPVRGLDVQVPVCRASLI